VPIKSPDSPVLTIAEAGQRYLGISPGSAYSAYKRGDLPVIRIGRLLRVPVAALERLLADTPCGVTTLKDIRSNSTGAQLETTE
jgi:hypothetical protein